MNDEYVLIAAKTMADKAEKEAACGFSSALQSYRAAAKKYRQAAELFPDKKKEYLAHAERCERLSRGLSSGSGSLNGGCALGSTKNTDSSKTTQKTARHERESTVKLTVEEALGELDSLVGLDGVKKKVSAWSAQVKFFKLREDQGLPVPDGFSYHMIFTGNPGTGKSTVARLMGQIYRALGILKEGQLVEVARNDLVAGYVGQTAIKTREAIDKAIGGVLFIDEAYMLNGSGNDFGQEAIDTVLKAMEDRRDELVVIMAGYSDPMAELIETNKGLKSRFNNIIHFDDYTGEELYRIFDGLCKKNGYKPTVSAVAELKSRFERLYENRGDDFGNARLVRNVFQTTVANQAARLMAKQQISPEDMSTVEEADLPNISDMK